MKLRIDIEIDKELLVWAVYVLRSNEERVTKPAIYRFLRNELTVLGANRGALCGEDYFQLTYAEAQEQLEAQAIIEDLYNI